MIERTVGTMRGDWKVSWWRHSPTEVRVTGPEGQELQIDCDGDLCVDPFPGEQRSGWDGDVASARYIPLSVIRAAIALLDEVQAGNFPREDV